MAGQTRSGQRKQKKAQLTVSLFDTANGAAPGVEKSHNYMNINSYSICWCGLLSLKLSSTTGASVQKYIKLKEEGKCSDASDAAFMWPMLMIRGFGRSHSGRSDSLTKQSREIGSFLICAEPCSNCIVRRSRNSR